MDSHLPHSRFIPAPCSYHLNTYKAGQEPRRLHKYAEQHFPYNMFATFKMIPRFPWHTGHSCTHFYGMAISPCIQYNSQEGNKQRARSWWMTAMTHRVELLHSLPWRSRQTQAREKV